jgi:hypothetical protein
VRIAKIVVGQVVEALAFAVDVLAEFDLVWPFGATKPLDFATLRVGDLDDLGVL